MTRLQHRAKTSPWLPFSEIDPIESWWNRSSTRWARSNSAFAFSTPGVRKNPSAMSPSLRPPPFSCFFAGDREHRGELVQLGRPRLFARRDVNNTGADARKVLVKGRFRCRKQSSFRRVRPAFDRFGPLRVVAEWQPKNSSMHFASVSNVSLANVAVTRPKKKVPETSGDHITLSRSPPNTGQPEFFRIIS